MSRLSRFLNQWRARALDREFEEELRFHLHARIDANLGRGMTRAEAEAEAQRHLGSTLRAREGMREARASGWLQSVARDCRHALRGLRRSPAFSFITVLLLALGIGATTAIFSVVNSVLIKPLPYPDSESLVRIVHAIGGIDQPFFSDQVFLTYAENSKAFLDLGAWSPGVTATITGQGDPEQVRTLTASRGVLTTLGVPPAVGRWFSPVDDTPGAPGVVLLTSGYWLRRFGGDPGVLHRGLTIDGRVHHVIGVMPDHFRFGREFDIVLPLRINRGAPVIGFRLLGVARLKPDITLAQANADSARILRTWLTGTGQTDPAFQARYQPSLRSLKQDVVGDIGRTLWVVMGAIGIVLLLACANVANLLLVRANARAHELAIRAALGASWTRLARHLFVESMILALLGGSLGIGLAYLSLRALVEARPSNLPRLSEIAIDPAVLGFALVISVISGLVFGVIPILKYARPRPLATVSAGTRGASVSRERQRSQHVLVAVQLALALVLLVSAGLMIRSFQALRRVDPGFVEPNRVQTFSISIPRTMVAEPERVTRMQEQILKSVAAVPGVAAASFTTRLPMGSDRNSNAIAVEGRPDDGRTPPNRHVRFVSPGLFHTLGTALVAGRDFTWDDLQGRRDLVIVSANLARELWGSPQAAMGKRIREYYDRKSAWYEVVGVVGDVYDDGLHQGPTPTVYWPVRIFARFYSIPGFQPRGLSFAVRTDRAGTESLFRDLREAVRSVSATLPLADVRTLDEVYDESLARTSFTLVMLALAGTMALLLGIFGVYGVISYAVSQRRREIGVRVALGAGSREIRRLFMRRGVALIVVGIAIGLGWAAATTRLMQSLLFGVTPLDPFAFAGMALVLAAAAILASWLPAQRALAVDPVEAMRAE